MQDLSQHILDVAENSVRAGARQVEIRLAQDSATDRLRLEIVDDGEGMGDGVRQTVLSPFTTSRTERKVGLGLSLLAQAAREAAGDCQVESSPGKGTRVVATFRHSHIDRKPLGELGETMLTLIVGNPEVNFLFELDCDGRVQRLDTKDIRASLGGAPLCSAAGMRTLRTRIGEVVQALPNFPRELATPSQNKGGP